MKVNSIAHIKALDQCEVGELVYFNYQRGKAWGIVLQREDRRRTTLGLLSPTSPELRVPTRFTFEGIFSCLSVGKDWGIGPRMSPVSYAGNTQFVERAGSLHLSEGKWLVCFAAPAGSGLGSLHFDLENGQLGVYPEPSAAPFLRWHVYGRAQDADRNAKPLFTMDVSA